MNVIEKIMELTDAMIIYIEASDEKRYERIQTRWEKLDEGSLTLEQFLEQEELNTEKELETIRNMADIIIENIGTKEELFAKIDTILLS